MNDDFAAAARQVKARWKALWAALRTERKYTPPRPTRDGQIVAEVLSIIGGATLIEDGIERPIDRGDVEGTLYHLREAVAATQRIRERQSKPALRAMKRRAGELRKAIEVGLPKNAQAYLEKRIARIDALVVAPRQKPKPDAFEKRLAAEYALELCERFGVAATTARTGKYCLVAAALYGNSDADLQYHCAKALAENRDKDRPRF